MVWMSTMLGQQCRTEVCGEPSWIGDTRLNKKVSKQTVTRNASIMHLVFYNKKWKLANKRGHCGVMLYTCLVYRIEFIPILIFNSGFIHHIQTTAYMLLKSSMFYFSSFILLIWILLERLAISDFWVANKQHFSQKTQNFNSKSAQMLINWEFGYTKVKILHVLILYNLKVFKKTKRDDPYKYGFV